MAKVTYVQHSGATHVLEVREGLTLMEAAVKNSVPGIDADCGGACACATCHIYVEPEWLGRLSPQTAMEASMLEFASDVEPNSRLACQIRVDAGLEGLIVHLPQNQH